MSDMPATYREGHLYKSRERNKNTAKGRERPKSYQFSDTHRPDYRPHVDLASQKKPRPISYPAALIKENEENRNKEKKIRELGSKTSRESAREEGRKSVKASKIPRHKKSEEGQPAKGQAPVRINDHTSYKQTSKPKMSGKDFNESQAWTDNSRGRSRRQQFEINVEITPHPRPRVSDRPENGASPRGTPGIHGPPRNQYVPSQFTHQDGQRTHRGNHSLGGDPPGPWNPAKHHGDGQTSVSDRRGSQHSSNQYNPSPSSRSSHTNSVDSLNKTSRGKIAEPPVQYVMKSKGNSRASSTSKAPDLSDGEKQAPGISTPYSDSQKGTSAAQYLEDAGTNRPHPREDRQQHSVKPVSDKVQYRYVDENSDSVPQSQNPSKVNENRGGKSVQFSDDLHNDLSRTEWSGGVQPKESPQPQTLENPQRKDYHGSTLMNGHSTEQNRDGQQSYLPSERLGRDWEGGTSDRPRKGSEGVTSDLLNQGYQFPDSEEDEQLDLDDIDSVYEGKDAYICYLMTEEGGMAGPLRLDINDVQVGLPSQVEVKKDEEGMRNRQTGSHGLNEFSSRSHSMLTLTIDTEQQDPDDENLYLTKRGKLTFVDLAGSEKVKDSESSDQMLKESNNINRSLLVLGNCISSLGDPKKRQGHIPYRDSKLTKLLADSLGGNGVTLMIACVTPSSHHVHETINTLRYASRAKKIKTKPIVKMDPREKLILSLKREVKILRNENVYLRQQLEFPAKPKGELQKSNDEKFMKFLKTQGKESNDPKTNAKGGTEAGLYEMLQEYMIENESLRSENSEMHQAKDRIKREQQLMYRENERLSKHIERLEREMRSQGGGNGGWQRQANGPPPQRQANGPPPQRQANGPPPQRQSNGPPPHQNLPPDQYYDQGPPPPRQGINKAPPPQNNQWKGTPPQRPINNRAPVEQYVPGPSPQAGRGKQSTPPSGPKRPPHRLADPIARSAIPPDYIQNGVGGYPDDGYMSPRGRPSPLHNGPIRQATNKQQ
uniref:Kinesin-like protein n=1 Tax=Crassostrea virginica TaxID=6565 RepID=A0A8B8EBS5_CRAVI|nr:uncharacterized protein LOC111133229 isoform X6 [Crassostrea virginica]